MSLVYRNPRIIGLLLLVLFTVLIVTFIILSFVTHAHVGPVLQTGSVPNFQCPCR